MPTSSLFVSIIVPCFNEEQVIEHAYQRIHKTMQSFKHAGYELIFINDGSQDSTLAILKSLATKDENLKIISFLEILVINLH
jgi:polyisoprenyl-phosphate glycosyltransferase